MKVKFWPSVANIPVTICNHRYDSDITISLQTDTRVLPVSDIVEAYAFKNNIKLGAFVSAINGTDIGIKDCEETGLIRHDIYFPTDMWKNPVTGVVELIPDYYSVTWTALGATYFPVTIGQSKVSRFPNHGQQIFDLSNGQYGHNINSGQFGTNNSEELFGVFEFEKNWFKNLFKRNPSSISFRNGQLGLSTQMLLKVLSGRNSGAGSASLNSSSDTFFGKTLGNKIYQRDDRDYFINYLSSTRLYDYYTTITPVVTKQVAYSYLNSELNKTKLNKGWFRDFTHWHFPYNDNRMSDYEEFIQEIKNNIGNFKTHYCSNGEAIEYMFLRDSVKRAGIRVKNSTVIVLLDVVDFFENLNTSGISKSLIFEQLNTPLTVKLNLTGTPLQGLNVKSSFGKAVNLGNNQYLIEVPFSSKEENFAAVILSEDSSSNYLSLNQPTISKNVVSGIATISSNIPVKAVLFEAPLSQQIEGATVKSRSNLFNSFHNFQIDVSKENWVGIISEAGRTNFIKL